MRTSTCLANFGSYTLLLLITFWMVCCSPKMRTTTNIPASDSKVASVKTDESALSGSTAEKQGAKAQSGSATDETTMATSSTPSEGQEPFSAAKVVRASANKKAAQQQADAAELLASAQAKGEATATKKQNTQSLNSLPARMFMKHMVKKLEKARQTYDGKQVNDKKAAKAINNAVKLGLIIAIVGLLLILLVDGYLGGIVLVVGLVVLLLGALEVI